MYALQQRIDIDSEVGLAFFLTRGKNTIGIDGYGSSLNIQITNINGYITLNYESDLSPGGIGQHSHTVLKVLYPWSAQLTDRLRVDDYSFQIPEPNHWITSSGFVFIQWVSVSSQAVTFDVECLSGEGKGFGYYDIYADAYQSDAERSCSVIWMRGRDVFKRFPNDIDEERVDIQIPRSYRLFTTTTCSNGLICVCTYHSLTWEVSGNITGSNNVDDINLDLIRESDNIIIQTQIVSPLGGPYSFTVYNDTELFYVSAKQDNQHLGRSASGTAS